MRIALGQEWPRLGALRRRLRRLETRPIPSAPDPAAPPVVAAVAADGGESRIVLAPLRIYILRVADSEGMIYFEECIPHSLDAADTLRFFFRSNERVQRLVKFLGLGWEDLLPRDASGAEHLLPMLRELLEWGALLRLAHGTAPRLILRDGLLRSVLLPAPVFRALQRALETAAMKNGHWLAGVAKRSAALRYLAAAFALEESFAGGEPRYARVPPEIECEAAPGPYRWAGERAMGKLYAARLEAGAPILAADIAAVCADAAPEILRRLADSARASFPLRGYPGELRAAHERACLSGIEAETLQAIFLDELANMDERTARAARGHPGGPRNRGNRNPMSATVTLCRGPTLGLLKGLALDAGRAEIEVVAPCRETPLPGFGEILLVETAPDTAMVGRVCRYQAAGRLISDAGDAYLADLSRGQDRPPPAVVTRLLRYTLKLQLLGSLRRTGGRFAYAAGERALAPFGSPVREPSDAALEYLCNVNLTDDPSAAPLGELAYGDTVRSSVTVRFSVARLKGRRSFVFARAGYGKSNLVKHLIAQLYRSPPDVGLLVFDPEGEYALPDADGRPGLVNVPELADRISLYTARRCDPAYRRIVRGPPTLDFADFLPQDIIANFVPPEKHDMVFTNLLRSMDLGAWKQLVAYLDAEGFKADDRRVADLIGYRPQGGKQNQADVSVSAIKNNLVPHLRRLHQSSAPIGRELIQNLRDARILIVDTSLLGGDDARAVTGLLLWRVFAHNQRHFTDVAAPGVRCLAVLEEAQSFLGERDLDDRTIFVRWVKEGRKYNLGALLVTQQPGAIADSIISQGDNFFAMHLLNERDLATLHRHNAHYSDDILGVIRGEPIRGNCYFWSAPDQPFVLPVRVRNFADSARPGPAPAPRPVPPKSDPASPGEALRQAVAAALNEDSRVWLYAVEGETEGERVGVIVSHDYLLNAVGERFRSGGLPAPAGDLHRWLGETMPGLVSELLSKKGGVKRFATLAGHKRPVWRLPRSRLRLAPAKKRLREAVAFATD